MPARREGPLAQEDKSQRTEEPTARRLEKAREEGRVPRSNEIPGMLALALFLLYGLVFGGSWMDSMRGFLVGSFSGAHRFDGTDAGLQIVFTTTAMTLLSLLAAPLALMVAAGIGGNFVQSRPVFTVKPFKPDLSKVNPFKGIKKVFALSKLVEGLKAFIKMVLYSIVAFTAIRDVFKSGLLGAPGPGGTLEALFLLCGKVFFRIVLLAAALALLDYLFKRYDFKRGMRMTKKEIRDERKETEGDPTVRAKVRSKQMSLARSRMMADVERATVVVTNPTHIAVALRYVPGETEVPQLLAKGRAKLAARIREIAGRHRIPVVSDPPLARMLYRSVPVGGFIPYELFRAVAEVLALVLQRDGRRGPRPAPGDGVQA